MQADDITSKILNLFSRMKGVLFITFLFFGLQLSANHLLTGRLSCQYVSSSQSEDRYYVQLELTRICFPKTGPFDSLEFEKSAKICVFDSIGQSANLAIELNFKNELAENGFGTSYLEPGEGCIKKGIYTGWVDLPKNKTYRLHYEQCCRTGTRNLRNSSTNGPYQGIHVITTASRRNSNTTLNINSRINLLLNTADTLQLNAGNTDADSLFFVLQTPYQSNLGGADFVLTCDENESYPINVDFIAGYSTNKVFGPAGLSEIVSNKMLVLKPVNEGLYLFAIAVFEYKSGKLAVKNSFEFVATVGNQYPASSMKCKTADLQVYPNPANEKVTITMPRENMYSWVLRNATGAIVQSGQHIGLLNLNTQTLPVGMYFIQLSTKGEFYQDKFAISHH